MLRLIRFLRDHGVDPSIDEWSKGDILWIMDLVSTQKYTGLIAKSIDRTRQIRMGIAQGGNRRRLEGGAISTVVSLIDKLLI